MKFKLRQYQKEASYEAVKFFNNGSNKNAIEVLPTGCIAGDSIINFNRAKNGYKRTIEHEYRTQINHASRRRSNVKQFVRSFLGNRIGLNEAINIIYSGFKCTMELTLENGFKIRATPEHKILTKQGWRELGFLSEFDSVMIDSPINKKSNPIKKYYRQVQGLIYHPYAGHCASKKEGRLYRVPYHRLAYEAELNNLSIEKLIDICRNDPAEVACYDFVNPEFYAIHHIDLDHKNNDPENLEKLSHLEHAEKHGKNDNWSNFGLNQVQYSSVKSIKKYGCEDVYDIQCVNPHNNFVANGIVVHNSGKSLIIADIAHKLTGNTLVFQPSKEILEQNLAKLHNYGILDTSVFSASLGSKKINRITLATIGSVIKKKEIFSQFNNIIVDECHAVNSKQGMYKEFFEYHAESKILGLTATPYRLQSYREFGSILKFLTRTKPKVFHDMIYHVQIKELFEQGYLAPVEYYPINCINVSRLQVNTTGADFTDMSVRRHYDEIDFKAELWKTTERLLNAGRKNLLIFTRFIDEANFLTLMSPDIEIVTGETKKKKRERILADFKAGKIKAVANVGVLTTGFDFPELETILIGRPTMSLALWYQMVGRGIRPHLSKISTWVVDMGGNFKRFGSVEDLKIDYTKNKLWHIESNGKHLTNVFYR